MSDLLALASAALNCELSLVDPPENVRARNRILMAQSADQTKYFIKGLRSDADASKRFQSSLTADRYFSEVGSPMTPKLLHHDRDHCVLVYEHIEGLSPGLPSNLDRLSGQDFARMGESLAEVHVRECELDPAKYRLNRPSADHNTGRLKTLNFEAYWMLSGAELQFWKIVQANALLFSAMFVPGSITNRLTAIHGDLRLDQFLVTSRTAHIIDWEEFSLGNPAKDVGTLCGDIFVLHTYQELSLIQPGMDDLDAKSHTAITNAGRRSREAIRNLISAYASASPHIVKEPGFLSDVSRFFIGHLVERVSTKSSLSSRLSGHDKAILGIALQMCRNPKASVSALGVAP